MDKLTGIHKGTGFVKFHDSNVVQQLIKRSSELESRLDEEITDETENNILKTTNLELNNRRLIILSTLNKEQIKDKGNSEKQKNSIKLQQIKSIQEAMT